MALPANAAPALAALFASLLASPAVAAGRGAAAPAPAPAPSTSAALERVPAAPAHTEFVVETNRKGQVTRVKSGKPSSDPAFNAMTYGNALQAFIRTADGKAVAGRYRLTYDYNPKNKRVRRSVALVRAGGVDPNALGAVDQMAALDRTARATKKNGTLPSLGSITGQQR